MGKGIAVSGVTKRFPTTPFDVAMEAARVVLGRSSLGKRLQGVTALDGIDLSVTSGEHVGIIGDNGSGKTTLLQLIAGLAVPTTGTVVTSGTVKAIMALGVGMRQELSGRENIYTDGAVRGLSRSEIDSHIEDIIEFADVGAYIDRPVSEYSSGMLSRLAFAMATQVDPEILIIDEALSVGDSYFQYKAADRIRGLCKRGKIIVIVSHVLTSILKLCNRVVWLDQGRIVMDGDPKDVVDAYRLQTRQNDEQKLLEDMRERIDLAKIAGPTIVEIYFVGNDMQRRHLFNAGEEFTLHIRVESVQKLSEPDFQLRIERTDGVVMVDQWAGDDGLARKSIDGICEIEVPFGPVIFGAGTYHVTVGLFEVTGESSDQPLAVGATAFGVRRPLEDYDQAALHVETDWACSADQRV